MAYEWILLDFDGTMVDTGKGIVSALKMATEEQGILDAPLEKTWLFIGPPIHSFARGALKLDEENAVALVKKFRKYYNSTEWKKSEPYAGMRALLDELHAAGKKIFVCTSKPEEIARMMLEYFDLPVDDVCGANDAKNLRDKGDIIRLGSERFGFPVNDARTVMVGDAPRDILAGQECGVETVAVYYGYGVPEELKAAHATHEVDSVAQLRAVLLGAEK